MTSAKVQIHSLGAGEGVIQGWHRHGRGIAQGRCRHGLGLVEGRCRLGIGIVWGRFRDGLGMMYTCFRDRFLNKEALVRIRGLGHPSPPPSPSW